MRTHHSIDRGTTSWKAVLGWLGLRVAVGVAVLALALALGTSEAPERARTAMGPQASTAR